MSAIEEIEKEVLALPLEQRVSLAEALLGSLPSPAEETTEAEEMAEAARREKEIESGRVKPRSEAEFWRRVARRRNK